MAVGDRRGVWPDRRTAPASPATSGSDERREMITGTPHAIASTTGQPEPLQQRREDQRLGAAAARRTELARSR